MWLYGNVGVSGRGTGLTGNAHSKYNIEKATREVYFFLNPNSRKTSKLIIGFTRSDLFIEIYMVTLLGEYNSNILYLIYNSYKYNGIY